MRRLKPWVKQSLGVICFCSFAADATDSWGSGRYSHILFFCVLWHLWLHNSFHMAGNALSTPTTGHSLDMRQPQHWPLIGHAPTLPSCLVQSGSAFLDANVRADCKQWLTPWVSHQWNAVVTQVTSWQWQSNVKWVVCWVHKNDTWMSFLDLWLMCCCHMLMLWDGKINPWIMTCVNVSLGAEDVTENDCASIFGWDRLGMEKIINWKSPENSPLNSLFLGKLPRQQLQESVLGLSLCVCVCE